MVYAYCTADRNKKMLNCVMPQNFRLLVRLQCHNNVQ